ncbi:3beta-hydroxysteroid-dehydrogenase/decarboxylase isoform 3 [Acorus calamus]|uniref:Reticulon-like protein n=1 Tax=Acorus calamus TaxID=4465 RepID=A0AAV9F1L3_ACOCL|nr:3beta-hydroxysteroid-dehydrogenase/decarboxylase isoform 3 [Acorus calamus]
MGVSDTLRDSFYENHALLVQGMKNVINVSRECNVERLIYNSSADVVFDGVHDIHFGDESMPYPWKFEDRLNELKAQAEMLVLCASGRDGLLTCALRPSNPFGPGDTQLVPFIVNLAKSVWGKFIFGSGANMCDFTYVENVAHAHMCAEKALCSEVTAVAGKPLFVNNLKPKKTWEFVSLIVEGLGYQRPSIHLPVRLILFIAMPFDWMYGKLGVKLGVRSPMIHQLACTRTFNCDSAQKHIGYTPIIPLEEGIASTVESFSHLAKDSPYSVHRDLSRPSKAEKLLGSGRVADLVLWRDDKLTFTFLLTLLLFYYWFLHSGRTFICSMATFLQICVVILFAHGFLPSKVFGFTIKKIPSSFFGVSEKTTKVAVYSAVSMWNGGVHTLSSLAQAAEWEQFFKVTCSLYIIKLLLSLSLSVLFGLGIVCLFTVFIVYEQYEVEVESMIAASVSGIKKLEIMLKKKLPGFLEVK